MTEWCEVKTRYFLLIINNINTHHKSESGKIDLINLMICKMIRTLNFSIKELDFNSLAKLINLLIFINKQIREN